MTLPQEIADAIEKGASEKTKAMEVEIKDRFYKYSPNKIAYLDGYETGRIEGATEWAGKAQDLKEALEKVKNITSWMDGDDPHCQALRRIVEPALAKYKEVSK